MVANEVQPELLGWQVCVFEAQLKTAVSGVLGISQYLFWALDSKRRGLPVSPSGWLCSPPHPNSTLHRPSLWL